MATVEKKVKTVRAKAAKTVAAPAAEAVPVAVAPPVVVPVVAADAEEKKTRQQLTSILDLSISQARCHTHLKANLGDEAIETEIRELRTQLKTATPAAAEEIKTKIFTLSKKIVRISSECPIATAIIMDQFVRTLLIHGMDQAKILNRKIVDIQHLYLGNVSQFPLFPLVENLPTWKSSATTAVEVKAEAAVETKVEAAAETVSEEASKTTFFTYVENSLKRIKVAEAYKGMRVSNRVRDFLSELIVESISRISTLSRIIVQTVIGVRTMNADHIKAVILILMADAGRSAADALTVTTQIDEKIKLYRTHLVAEREKKLSALSEDKKNEFVAKQKDSETARKQKQIELAKKRVAALETA